MRIDLRYGEGSLQLDLNTSVESIAPQTIDRIPDSSAELLRVLENPIDSRPLSKLVSDANSISIVVNHIEHPELVRNLLHFLLNSVETFSSNPDDITIIYPVDSEQRITSSEIDDLLGSPESRGHSLVLHNPRSKENLTLVGETPSNSTPVLLNERFLRADLKIGLGEIRPDVFVGATGGRMSVLPYVSGNRTITRNAKLRTIRDFGPFALTTPACVDMTEASQLGGLDFIVNYVSDWKGNVAHIFAGHPYSSWESGIGTAKTLASADFTRRADIAFVSAGGLPYDRTLYEAIASIYAAYDVTENGGAIVLVAECSNGVGPKGFERGISEFSSENEVSAASETGFEVGFDKAQFFWNVLTSRKLVICSQLRTSFVEEQLRCKAVRNPQDGLEVAKHMLPSNKKIAVIPDGIRTVPHFNSH